MKPHLEGLWSVHSAVFIFGLTALFSKLIDLSAVDITFLRSVFAVVAIFFFIKFKRESILLRQKKDYLIALLLGVFLTLHWVTYFHAMQVSSIAIGMIALYSYPVITVILEPFFHQSRPKAQEIMGGLFVLYGIYLMIPEFSFDSSAMLGVLWGVLSALTFSLRNIIHGRYFSHYPARHGLFYQTAVVILLLTYFSGPTIINVNETQWFQLLVLGVIFTALPHTLFANSLLFLKAKTVSLIACMQVVYGVLFAMLILSEIPDFSTIIGGLIVMSAAVYETLLHRKK